jgi:GNAT superfamily N-acetyltransferase
VRASDHARIAPLVGEAEALHARLSPAFFAVPNLAGLGARVEELMRAALPARDQVLLVAEDGRRDLCGFLHACLYDTPARAELVAARRCHIDSLVVAPSRRRKGCGRALVDAVRAWAKERGATQLMLTVWAGNTDAERFYSALGLEPVSQVLGAAL